MQLRILAALTLSGLALFLFLQRENPAAAAEPPANGKRVPVIVELFTSEGCSSCPPADALLRKLEEAQPVSNAEIIVLGEHVDYWNYIGWTDRFSSKQFTERQQQYADRFNLDSSYTPQMVVDGSAELNGADESRAKKAIAQSANAARVNVSLLLQEATAQSVQLKVNVDASPVAADADVVLAVTEAHLQTHVKKGENGGHTLNHTGAVRWLQKIGEVHGSAFSAEPVVKLDPGWKRADLRAVVFVQEKRNRRIVGAAAVRLQ